MAAFQTQYLQLTLTGDSKINKSVLATMRKEKILVLEKKQYEKHFSDIDTVEKIIFVLAAHAKENDKAKEKIIGRIKIASSCYQIEWDILSLPDIEEKDKSNFTHFCQIEWQKELSVSRSKISSDFQSLFWKKDGFHLIKHLKGLKLKDTLDYPPNMYKTVYSNIKDSEYGIENKSEESSSNDSDSNSSSSDDSETDSDSESEDDKRKSEKRRRRDNDNRKSSTKAKESRKKKEKKDKGERLRSREKRRDRQKNKQKQKKRKQRSRSKTRKSQKKDDKRKEDRDKNRHKGKDNKRQKFQKETKDKSEKLRQKSKTKEKQKKSAAKPPEQDTSKTILKSKLQQQAVPKIIDEKQGKKKQEERQKPENLSLETIKKKKIPLQQRLAPSDGKQPESY